MTTVVVLKKASGAMKSFLLAPLWSAVPVCHKAVGGLKSGPSRWRLYEEMRDASPLRCLVDHAQNCIRKDVFRY